jgi:TolB protein
MLAFIYNDTIYRMSREDGDFQHITNTASSNNYPSFSSDGRWLVFVSEKVLYKMHPFGRRIAVLQSGFDDVGRVSWSPDGEWFVFAALTNNQSSLYRMRPSGRELQQLTTSFQDEAPAWSPNGEWIMFNRRDGPGVQIFRIKPDGSQVQQISDGIGNNRNPVWSPDGNRIVFLSSREIDDEIYQMQSSGRDARRIGQRPSYTWYRYPVTWIDEWIVMDVFRNGSWGTYQMRPDGTGLIAMPNLPHENQVPSSLSLSPIVDQDWCGECLIAVSIAGILISRRNSL